MPPSVKLTTTHAQSLLRILPFEEQRDERDIEEDIVRIQEQLIEEPWNTGLWSELAKLWREADNLTAEEDAIDSGLSVDECDTDLLLAKANLLMDPDIHDKPEAALALIKEALNQDPLRADTSLLEGECLAFLNLNAQAIQSLEIALKLAPEEAFNTRTLLLIAECYEANNDMTRAAEYLRRIVELEPENTTCLARISALEKYEGHRPHA